MQAMQALRDHWQAVVVDRLMRLAAAAGEPLAHRALTAAQLEERRVAVPGPASARIAQAAVAPAAAPLNMAVIPTELLQRGVAAALAGAAEVPGCDTAAGAVRTCRCRLRCMRARVERPDLPGGVTGTHHALWRLGSVACGHVW